MQGTLDTQKVHAPAPVGGAIYYHPGDMVFVAQWHKGAPETPGQLLGHRHGVACLYSYVDVAGLPAEKGIAESSPDKKSGNGAAFEGAS